MSDPKDFGFDTIQHDDIILLESLIKSPVFGALKRALAKYRDVCMSELLTSESTQKLYQMQGRVAGINAIENLPSILVRRQHEKDRQIQEKKTMESELQMRKDRIFDPSLPPVPSSKIPRVVRRPPRKT